MGIKVADFMKFKGLIFVLMHDFGCTGIPRNSQNARLTLHGSCQIGSLIIFCVSVRLALMKIASLFYYLAYFCYYLWVSLHFLVLFMSPIVLFQLTFTFIYLIFGKKFSVSAK